MKNLIVKGSVILTMVITIRNMPSMVSKLVMGNDSNKTHEISMDMYQNVSSVIVPTIGSMIAHMLLMNSKILLGVEAILTPTAKATGSHYD